MFEHTEDKALDRIAEKIIQRLKAALGDGKPLPRMLSTGATAPYLGLSVSSVQHLRSRGVIPCVKINRRVMYDRLALDRWVESKQERGKSNGRSAIQTKGKTKEAHHHPQGD